MRRHFDFYLVYSDYNTKYYNTYKVTLVGTDFQLGAVIVSEDIGVT